MTEPLAVRVLRSRRDEIVAELEAMMDKADRERLGEMRRRDARRFRRLVAEIDGIDAAIRAEYEDDDG